MAAKTSGGDPKKADFCKHASPVSLCPYTKVNPVGVSRFRAFTGCLPRRTVNIVRKLSHDGKKSCDAAGLLAEKEFICGLVDDKFSLGGGIVIAPEDVYVIRTMVDQNRKDMKVPVQMPSHRQHVYCIRGKRRRSEGSSGSAISFFDDDLEGVDLPHNDALVISLNVGDHEVNKILVDPGSSVNVMYKNLFEMLNLKLEDLKQTDIVMTGVNEVPVQPMGVVTLPIYVDPVTRQTEFLVVDVSSSYNAIIGRPWLHEMKAVPSTYHQLLKFHLDMGIKAIRGDQKASKECCMIEVKAKEKAKKTDAKIGGDDSSVAAVEKVDASSEHLQVNSLPGVAAPDDA